MKTAETTEVVRRATGRTTTTVETEALPETPRQRLARLETEVIALGMSEADLGEIRDIGECNDQVNQRAARLEEWIAARSR